MEDDGIGRKEREGGEKEGKKEGRKERRKEGRKEGGRKEGWRGKSKRKVGRKNEGQRKERTVKTYEGQFILMYLNVDPHNSTQSFK